MSAAVRADVRAESAVRPPAGSGGRAAVLVAAARDRGRGTRGTGGLCAVRQASRHARGRRALFPPAVELAGRGIRLHRPTRIGGAVGAAPTAHVTRAGSGIVAGLRGRGARAATRARGAGSSDGRRHRAARPRSRRRPRRAARGGHCRPVSQPLGERRHHHVGVGHRTSRRVRPARRLRVYPQATDEARRSPWRLVRSRALDVLANSDCCSSS